MSALSSPIATMSSPEIVEVINEERKADAAGGEYTVLRHADFMVKLEKHPGIDSTKFSGQYKDSTGRMLKCYYLPKREAELMVMSESLKVQTRVYDRLTAAESASLGRAPIRIDSAVQALKLAPLAMRAARAFGLDKNVAAISANQYVCTVTGHNLLKEFGATHLPAENQETQWFTPTELSPEAKVSARKLNEALASAGLQERRGKVWELTPAGHAYARLFDTGKQHNSGVMVQQVKWSAAVLAELRHSGSLL